MQFAAEREPKSRLYLHQSREFTNGNFDVKTQLPWLQYESNSVYSGFIRDVKGNQAFEACKIRGTGLSPWRSRALT